MIFLITSSVFAKESCKKYESELDLNLLCYEGVLYFHYETVIVNGFEGVEEKSSYELMTDKNGKPRTCKCLPDIRMHID